MKKVTAVFLAFIVAVITVSGLLFAAQSARAGTSRTVPNLIITETGSSCSGNNLLANPSFEGEYSAYQLAAPGHPDCGGTSCPRAQMAPEWHPFWRDNPRDENWMNIMPEYKPSLPYETPPRVRSGEKSQHYFSFWSTHEGGMYQQVTAVPGGQYCFSLWGQAWSSRTTLPGYVSDPNDHGFLNQRVGIDPTGGTDWQSPNVVWSEMRMQYDEFGEFVISATAQADSITVFAWSQANIPVKHNDVYWDDATLTLQQYAAVSTANIVNMTDVDAPEIITSTVGISMTAGMTWTAVLDPSGAITPTLSAPSGSQPADLLVTIDSSSLLTGTYQTTLTISFDPAVPGTPAQIPITLYVVEEINRVYLPSIQH
ncbi:MAG TPA: hypothetical protein EYH05_04750 [Anaerolineae bacterium]|nr:hypothetical protein [Anaerolineae bacterium]